MPTSTDSGAVLIVGQRPDPHIDRVVTRLNSLGCMVLLLDRYRHDEGISLTFGFDGELHHTLYSQSLEIDLDNVRAVWWRVKPNRPADFGFFSLNVEEAFATREWFEVLRALSEITPHAQWINPMASHVRASRKVYQLWLAGSVGLRCPRTIITNSSAHVLRAFPVGTPLIYKTLSSFIQPPDQIVFTRAVDRASVEESAEQIAVAPGIFQERVPKDHELRITVVGESLFVAAVDSQSDPQTALDWRRDQGRSMYRRADITDETRRQLLSFHKRAGMVFATYDLIVTPSGWEIFLECNPGGQWLWLEDALELPISAAVAHALNSHAGR